MDSITQFLVPREKTQSSGHFRPNYHFSAPKGWINDPNGLVYFNGWYHLFYQYNPSHLEWASMFWGHAVSKDMLHWKDLPIALTPDMPYDKSEEGGCFSGSAVVHDGKLYLFYTGSIPHDGTVTQTQNLAISEDGVHFTKFEGNPLISTPPAGANGNFRDPKVFREGSLWYMVVGGCLGDDYAAAAGRVFLYRSEDLLHWEFFSTLYACEPEDATMLECPDFFPLNGQWVLTTSPISTKEACPALCIVGDMDFSSGKFTPKKKQPLDFGGYWYAPQSFLGPEGQRIQISWQNTWQFLPWFNDWGPTKQENWRGALSVPHILSLDEDCSLRSAPISLEPLYIGKKTEHQLQLTAERLMLQPENPFSFELKAVICPNQCPSRCIEIGLLDDGIKYTNLILDMVNNMAVLCLFDSRSDHLVRNASLPLPGDREFTIRIQLDKSSVEVIVDDRIHMTETVYPSVEQRRLWMRTPYQSAVVKTLTIASVANTWE
ncbi:MAG: glycoside hydrolase family 32 protein [Faecousia sp.]